MKGMPGGMAQLLKQANQMQSKMKKAQEDFASKTFEGTAGGGAIKATVTGDYLLKTLAMSPEIIKENDPEMLQDLIVVAVNDAIKVAKTTYQKEMDSITGGMKIPGM